ncbi:hypothetical protein O0I10_004857 [Lichtheimia ornata]|uniref:F-box domain-containing protein n=1 Tax=Lichtheimia ornata TaxID=688661 RepID=A0AAD7V7T2_9FUNG|nr:uncharacterized protein O0I10_004857 [Lichtheimia ornata]KAJ8659492.1 hypothetical protein O0I10_004857 [Lichtheimia ornata]
MIHLPQEIVTSVVSELRPMDCNECLQVSRHWRHVIPQAASQLFQDITVDDDSLHALASIDLVGHFVRTARLKFEHMDTMMKVMDRLMPCSLLRKLELRNVHIEYPEVMHTKLKSCFKKWRLDTLALVNVHAPTMNLVDYILLATEHNVSHFAFTCGDEGSYFHVQRQLLERSNLSTLVSLVIDNLADLPADIYRSAITALLSFTPNIEYLELATYFIDDTFMSTILTLCPKIIHVDLSSDFLTTDDEVVHPRDYLQLAASYDHQGESGLRYYWNRTSRVSQADYDIMLEQQSTLESVYLDYEFPAASFAPDWGTFNTRLLSNNTTLKYLSIPLYRQGVVSLQYEDGYSSWLNTYQALEHLQLLSVQHAFGVSMMHTLQYKLPSLRRIDIEFTENAGAAGHLELLEALHHRCNHTETLKELQLFFRRGYNQASAVDIISTALTIHTLERLTVDCCNCLDERETLAFIENLRTSLPRLTHLGLARFSTLSANMIHALASLDRIKSLAFLRMGSILTEVEAESLISTMGTNLKKLYFVNCYFLNNSKAHIESLAKNYPVECIISDYD